MHESSCMRMIGTVQVLYCVMGVYKEIIRKPLNDACILSAVDPIIPPVSTNRTSYFIS